MRGNDFNHSYGNCSVDCFFLWRWNERSNEWSNTTFNDYRLVLCQEKGLLK